ncbi:MAG TPA: M81 family metallopeptidase [bacterium]|nr:M81 family metallopeptidase [bacterium]
MRIGIAGISHEALTFSPVAQTMRDFRVLRGAQVLEYPGLAGAVRALDIEPVPVLVATARCPSGVVDEGAHLQLRDELVDGLRRAGPLDGVCLILHGAMLVENIGSGETDQVRAVRAALGRDIPIAVRLDPHANLTEEFANNADTWACFRTAPHRDQAETLHRTLALLARAIRANRRPRPVFIRLPLLLPGERSTTHVEPMRSLLAMAREIEQMPGILNAEVLIGFGWADTWHAGANVAVVGAGDEDLPEARRQARRLAQAMWDRRREFTFDQEIAQSADEAIETALRAPERSVFVTDSGDNPTAGAPGDSTHFLARLLAQKVPDAVVAGIPDPESARACFAAGAGGTVSLAVGGKLDAVHGAPVELTGTVEHVYRPPSGDEAGLATVRANGVRVIISDRRYVYRHPDDFRKAGLDPVEHKLVVIKLGYLMAPLREIAPREILALTPGYADMDFTRLPYRYVTRPIFPLDPEVRWHPIITNVAGYDEGIG